MNPPRGTANRCPAANTCEITDVYGPPCGEEPSHLPPYATAESVCVRALAGEVQTVTAKIAEGTLPTRSAEQNANAGWFQLERAMATTDNAEAAEFFDSALEHANMAMHNRYSWFRHRLNAAMLHLYLPTLAARRDGHTPGEQEQAMLRQGVGILYDAAVAAPAHVAKTQHILDALAQDSLHQPCLAEGERNSIAAKLLVMMLAARQNVLLYPASSRESQGRGESITQNHDAYVLRDGQKTPVKIKVVKQATASNTGSRHAKYDDQTVYINIAGWINETLNSIWQRQPELYAALQYKHGGRPQVIDVGRMIRTELNGRQLDEASSTLVGGLASRLEQTLLGSRDSRRPHSTHQYPTRGVAGLAWNILPREVVALQQNLHERDSPEKQRNAVRARELYLRYGNSQPGKADLERLIDAMRQVRAPYILVRCAAAYIDLARNPQTSPENAVRLVEASQILTNAFAAKNWHEVQPSMIDLLYRSQLERAYNPMYKKSLSGEGVDITDQERLYLDLLRTGHKSLEPAKVLDPRIGDRDGMRGVQFEIGIHILNARRNIRNGKILQWMWPSLPREDMPHDFDFNFRNGWDAAVTTGTFLQQGSTCRHLQLKTAGDDGTYSPNIIVVSGRDDLDTRTSADIVVAALQELDSDPDKSARAKAQLNTYEQLFIRKINDFVERTGL